MFMNIIYRTGYQNFYMANNTLVYLFMVYLTAFSSSNSMPMNGIIIPKLERMWKDKVVDGKCEILRVSQL
jgi:hypothetical protein